MYRHSFKTHEKFKSKTEKTVIIGGETDFCAERFGYKAGKNGISPALHLQRVTPSVSSLNVRRTDYVPVIGKVAFLTTRNELYLWEPGTASPAFKALAYDKCDCVNTAVIDGADHLLFVGNNRITLFNVNGTIKYIYPQAYLAASVIHCGRIFAADLNDGYILRWSGFDFTKWIEGVDGTGYVRLNPDIGKIVNLHVLGDKIVILRERGITMLNTLGDSRHMRLDVCNKHCLPAATYANSSIICGGKLWICTQKGMYVYDGNTLSKAPYDEIMEGFTFAEPKVVGERYVYYTATRGDLKCLFEYDTETGGCTTFAKGGKCQFFVGSDAYAFNDTGYLYELLPDLEDVNRVWVSKPVTFGTGKTAVLKSLTIEGSGNFKVETDCDGRKLQTAGAGKHPYAESGQCFTFKVTGAGSITEMTAEWEVR